MEKNVFVLAWLPCSGKWTQWSILAEKLNAHRIQSWARLDMIIRWEVSPELKHIASKVRSNPKSLTEQESWDIERAKLWEDFWEESQHLILDGFGRKESTNEILYKVFWVQYLTYLWFHINKRCMYKRAHNRYIDPENRQSYKLSCPSEAYQIWLIKRESDTPEVLWRRFQSFEHNTKWVLENHKRNWWRVIKINAGHQEIELVTSEMLAQIRKVFPDIDL